MLPRLILIADRFTLPDVADRAVSAAKAGVPWVVLRDRSADARSFRRSAVRIVSMLRALPQPPLVSITADVECARHLRTHLHLGGRDVAVEEARRHLSQAILVGYSAHDEDEAEKHARAAVPSPIPDYFFFSPIFKTDSKPGAEEVGLDALVRFVRASGEVPVFALGGIDPPSVADCIDAGAQGVAVLSGILRADDIPHAVASYLARFES